MEVDGNHNYFVTGSTILVHNKNITEIKESKKDNQPETSKEKEMSNTEIENRFAELVSFIRDTIGEHDILIARETLIEGDLGVSGLDAEELILEFSKKYKVDISNFRFKNYFYGEPGILDVIGINGRKRKPFTVGHLEKAIIAGRLDKEVINS